MTVKDLTILIGLIAAIGGPLVQYGRLTERQEKNDYTLTQQGQEVQTLRGTVQQMREDGSVKEQLIRLTEQVNSLRQEIQELKARRR